MRKLLVILTATAMVAFFVEGAQAALVAKLPTVCHSKACDVRVTTKRRATCKSHACLQRTCVRPVCQNRVAGRRYSQFVSRLPYAGGGTRWAIPWYIIACESGGSWYAHNASGASGPYQLLGWGAPYPATTYAAKIANHKIAARVWAGGAGRSNWVC